MISQMQFHEPRSLIGNMIRTVVTLGGGCCIAFANTYITQLYLHPLGVDFIMGALILPGYLPSDSLGLENRTHVINHHLIQGCIFCLTCNLLTSGASFVQMSNFQFIPEQWSYLGKLNFQK